MIYVLSGVTTFFCDLMDSMVKVFFAFQLCIFLHQLVSFSNEILPVFELVVFCQEGDQAFTDDRLPDKKIRSLNMSKEKFFDDPNKEIGKATKKGGILVGVIALVVFSIVLAIGAALWPDERKESVSIPDYICFENCSFTAKLVGNHRQGTLRAAYQPIGDNNFYNVAEPDSLGNIIIPIAKEHWGNRINVTVCWGQPWTQNTKTVSFEAQVDSLNEYEEIHLEDGKLQRCSFP